jgi:hypothetical protein
VPPATVINLQQPHQQCSFEFIIAVRRGPAEPPVTAMLSITLLPVTLG